MEHGALGSLGVYAAKVVGKVPRQEQDCATTHHHRLMDPTVTEQKHRCRCAVKDTVQVREVQCLYPQWTSTSYLGSMSIRLSVDKIITLPNSAQSFTCSFVSSNRAHMFFLNPVDGKWATWASWSACTVSCGGGARQRTRDCSDPVPQYGGGKCEGSDVQSDFCNSDPCPSECWK